MVGDENPVRIAHAWRKSAARKLCVPFYLVDADVVVPTSLFPKEEFAARTIRPKIHRVWEEYLRPLPSPAARTGWTQAYPAGLTIDPDGLMATLKAGRRFRGRWLSGRHARGREAAQAVPERAAAALRHRPQRADALHDDRAFAHLHFGHISPLTIALAVQDSGTSRENIDAFLEELIVRRELAINFVARNPDYDRLAGCPEWARKTLAEACPRPPARSLQTRVIEAGETHDPLWNAAQKEMVLTGRMHNYLRMYWAKKILEWTPDAETAFDIALDLNDRYEMDGRDPNGYAGVAWAIGGKHDRPWPERPIFGTVRFMSYESTRRKFDSAAYMERVRVIEQEG